MSAAALWTLVILAIHALRTDGSVVDEWGYGILVLALWFVGTIIFSNVDRLPPVLRG